MAPSASHPFDPFKPIILANPATPNLQLQVIPYGLTVTRLLLTRSNGADEESAQVHDLIAGPEKETDHRDRGRNFFGPIVGPFANRLPAGESRFAYSRRRGDRESGMQEASVDLPEWSAAGVCHHGGPEPSAPKGDSRLLAGPFDRMVWQPVEEPDEPEGALFSVEELSTLSKSHATWKLFRADVEEFPGGGGAAPQPRGIRVEVIFTLSPAPSADPTLGKLLPQSKSAGIVRVEYRARFLDSGSSDANQITPLNITQHWGFNLSASDPSPAVQRAEQGRIDNHQLRVLKSLEEVKVMDLESNGLPTGKLLSIASDGQTSHDWTEEGQGGLGKTIIDGIPKGGYDHFYAWTLDVNNKDKLQAFLHSSATMLTLAFRTNQSGFQLYTGNGQPTAPADPLTSGGTRKLIHRVACTSASEGSGPGEAGNALRSAAFIEFGHPHATFLHKSLQDFIGGGEDTLLRAGDTYRHWVSIEVLDG